MENVIINNLMETCEEALEYISINLLENKLDNALKMIINIKELIEKILKFLCRSDINAEVSEKYCYNIIYSIEKIEKDIEKIQKIFSYEIFPFCKELKINLYFETVISIDKNQLENYIKERENAISEFAKSNNDNKCKYKYKTTIIVVAYNKLDYTKKAIESIYQNTDFTNNNAELITINNGSTDGTEEYFESLPNEKKINLKVNILGNGAYKYLVEGKYFLAFSNDVVATPKWLDNLVKCIESDEKIFWVVPTCNEDGISNAQGMKIDYENSLNSIDKIYEFGDKYNFSNRLLWEERNLLMPFIWIGRSRIFEYFDLADKSYLQHEFVDDDLSTSLRRLGLKQILAKDTFMHHFGSVTLGEARKDKSLENMREVYYKKWGVDAWDSRGEVEGFEELLKYDIYDNPKILFIEPKFGTNTLNIKKILRDKGIKVSKMVAAIFDRRYLPDARYMYDEIIAVNSTKEIIEDEEKYSLISFGTYINEIEKEDIIAFLESLYHKLENKGQIIFTIKNFRNANIIFGLLTNNPLEVCGYEKIDFHGCDFDRLFEILSQNELLNSFEVNAIYKHTKEVDLILSLDDSINKMTASAIERLKNEIGTKYYTFVINKNG